MAAQRVWSPTTRKVEDAAEMAFLQLAGFTTQEVTSQKLISTLQKLVQYVTLHPGSKWTVSCICLFTSIIHPGILVTYCQASQRKAIMEAFSAAQHYCMLSTCRRKYLLDYFADECAHDDCGMISIESLLYWEYLSYLSKMFPFDFILVPLLLVTNKRSRVVIC